MSGRRLNDRLPTSAKFKMAFQQLIWLGICACVPTYCLFSRRHTALVAWLCVSLSLECIALYNPININAFRAGGLIVLGSSVVEFRDWSSTSSGKWVMLQLVSLAMLGVAFGFLFPWPDETLLPSNHSNGPGRSVIYLVRNICDAKRGIILLPRGPELILRLPRVSSNSCSLGQALRSF